MKIDGRCHCGEVTFAAEVDPNAINISPWRQSWRRFVLHWVDTLADVPASERGA